MKPSSNKRPRLAASSSDETRSVPAPISPTSFSQSGNPAAPSSFRNVSACYRCRQRKNRCDQKLPSCSACEKARVKCVGFDPLTKREIPRTYVYYLESRVSYLESLLSEHAIPFCAAEEFNLGSGGVPDQTPVVSPRAERAVGSAALRSGKDDPGGQNQDGSKKGWEEKQDELNNLASNIGMVSVQGASDPRYLGSTSGISFARVVFSAVRSSVSGPSTEKNATRVNKPGSIGSAAATANGASKRDQLLRLQSKPMITPAPFPERALGLHLVNLYFEHANPQIPILHRGEFMTLFERAYATVDEERSPRQLYMLNIVFAIGAGIILEDSNARRSPNHARQETGPAKHEKYRMSGQQKQPEEYHASAVKYLESLGSTTAADEGFGGGLEELQAVLLLAGFALLRPVPPGLWYITGFAVRLAVDLGLHYEDGSGIDINGGSTGQDNGHDVVKDEAGGLSDDTDNGVAVEERGRRQWIRDLRRRLWWCVYSFDRLVSTCVGRPFGITDQVITTGFPSVLDDTDITTSGFRISSHNFDGPSYKRVSHHYFRLRLLQSEILHVLQYRQAQKAHENAGHRNRYMHTRMTSSFLQLFPSFREWRTDMDYRLLQWKNDSPLQEDITVAFSVQFLELNYWQALIMLYRQSLSVPPTLASEINTSEDVITPTSEREEPDDEEEIYSKLAVAGRRVLELYRELHKLHLVNYTYLATVHIFMAGIAFLYALWHSASVRSRVTHGDVKSTIKAATSILEDLIDKCPPAEACRDAFERMSKATLKMCLSTTGFGSRSPNHHTPFQPRVYDNGTRPSVFGTEFQPQPDFSTVSQPPPGLGLDLQASYSGNSRDGHSFVESVEGVSDIMQPNLQSTPPSRLLQYQGPSDAPAQHRQYYSNPNHIPPSLYTTASFTTDNVPDDIYDFTPNDFDFLAMNDDGMAVYQGNSGLHLGYDAEHDWSEGVQTELFGDFFFGGAGNAVNAEQ